MTRSEALEFVRFFCIFSMVYEDFGAHQKKNG